MRENIKKIYEKAEEKSSASNENNNTKLMPLIAIYKSSNMLGRHQFV